MSDVAGPNLPSGGLRNTFEVINRLVSDGIIQAYAVTGAVAALYYLEPVLTTDLDILIAVKEFENRPSPGLVTLAPVFDDLRKSGYTEFKHEGIIVEGWPVQFLPIANDLDKEALEQAIEPELPMGEASSIRVRVLRAEHVVANALRVGRPKDKIRVGQFLDENAVDLAALRGVMDRHALRGAWARFCVDTGRPDPYRIESNP